MSESLRQGRKERKGWRKRWKKRRGPDRGCNTRRTDQIGEMPPVCLCDRTPELCRTVVQWPKEMDERVPGQYAYIGNNHRGCPGEPVGTGGSQQGEGALNLPMQLQST